MDNSIYPYKLLDKFNEAIKRLHFAETRELLEQLLTQIEHLTVPGSNYPYFIIRCLLIDILMTLFNAMNQSNINFKLYGDIYYETLYYIRSCIWQEKKQEITDNILQLLNLLESEQYTIRANQIQKYLEENYSSAELSIATMAEYFHVCNAHMSYLFKKELGEPFVDYLWKFRFEKSKDMLLHTDLSVEAIGASVGYVNSSSFCRKFKQKTGMTPSQFRASSTHT